MSEEKKDQGFSEVEKRMLASVLDEIIPPRDDGTLPGAGQLGVAAHVEEAVRNTPDLRSMIMEGLSDLDRLARGRNVPGFAELSREDKRQLLNEQAFVLPLTFHVYVGYYQHDRVVEALGIEPRPPHPKGYDVKPNDLTILDAVRRRPKLYREC